MREFPEVVLYSSQGATQVALVLSAREGEVSHLGKNGEPLLTLAVIKKPGPNAPHKRPTGLQAVVATPEIEIQHDVVHASHEFDAEFLKKHGSSPAQIASQRGHGEWTEYEGDEAETIARLRSTVSEIASQRNQAQSEAAKQKSRADLAESVVESLRKELDAAKSVPPADPAA